MIDAVESKDPKLPKNTEGLKRSTKSRGVEFPVGGSVIKHVSGVLARAQRIRAGNQGETEWELFEDRDTQYRWYLTSGRETPYCGRSRRNAEQALQQAEQGSSTQIRIEASRIPGWHGE